MTIADRAKRGSRSYFVGVDVGGTFTDVVATDGSFLWRAKASSTSDDIGRGVLEACTNVAGQMGLGLEELLQSVERFGLGTTEITNVLAAQTGLRTGLITTQGFEDLQPLSRGRLVREDGWLTPPPQIVPRLCIIGVNERMDRQGNVMLPLDPDEVARAVHRLVDVQRVEAIAVSFLWSFRNPRHEDEAMEVCQGLFPDLPIVSGARCYPVIHEYERTMLATLNAYTSGAFQGVEELAEELTHLGSRAKVLLVHSGGGSISIPEARRFPIGLAESGPAAGVAGAQAVAVASGFDNLVTCDMGGTSFDISVIFQGQPSRLTRGDLMGYWTSLARIDIESIGAGGGSVGWVDTRGMLRVGPQSSGAIPGPACYGRGGSAPTVTDALVVLGYIDPARFLGGSMFLDADAARTACGSLGVLLSLEVEEVAWGIRQLALEGMVRAVRSRIVDKGHDPRSFSLVSYGGCGGLFTGDIARLVGMKSVLIPALSSVLSAFGAATSDIRRERVTSLAISLVGEPQPINEAAGELVRLVEDDLATDGIVGDRRHVSVEADVRFRNQVAELTVEIPSLPVDHQMLDQVRSKFLQEYSLRYGAGSIMEGVPIELVTLRAVGIGRTDAATLPRRESTAVPGTAILLGHRPVRVDREAGGVDKVELFAVDDISVGEEVIGPALLDAKDTTIWVPRGTHAVLDEWGTFILEELQ